MDQADEEYIIEEIESGTCPCCGARTEEKVMQKIGPHIAQKSIHCTWTGREVAKWMMGSYNLNLENHEPDE